MSFSVRAKVEGGGGTLTGLAIEKTPNWRKKPKFRANHPATLRARQFAVNLQHS
tara:strand:- start:49 stop:210 length:162 start_codon:yes stop_codon:yes gene_type:complete